MNKLLKSIQLALLRPLLGLITRLLQRRLAEFAARAQAPKYAYARAASSRSQRVIDGEYRRLPDEPNRW